MLEALGILLVGLAAVFVIGGMVHLIAQFASRCRAGQCADLPKSADQTRAGKLPDTGVTPAFEEIWQKLALAMQQTGQERGLAGADTGLSDTWSDSAKREMVSEMEGVANGGEPHALTTGLGAMKMARPEIFFEGWTKLLLEAEVYCVGIAGDSTGTRFVMTDKEDKRYLVVFTRRDLAEALLTTTEKLSGVIPMSGKELFPDAQQHGVGVWFNPINEICTLRLTAEMIPRFLEASESFLSPADQEVIKAMPPPIPLTEPQVGIFDHPVNELERKIVAARNRSMPLEVFVREFLDSETFILVPSDQIDQGGEKPGLVRNPRLFSIVYPEYNSLCFYSHPSRIKPTTDQYPEFRFAVVVKVRDLLTGLKAPCGITINPYWDIQMEWNPEQVARSGFKSVSQGS